MLPILSSSCVPSLALLSLKGFAYILRVKLSISLLKTCFSSSVDPHFNFLLGKIANISKSKQKRMTNPHIPTPQLQQVSTSSILFHLCLHLPPALYLLVLFFLRLKILSQMYRLKCTNLNRTILTWKNPHNPHPD